MSMPSTFLQRTAASEQSSSHILSLLKLPADIEFPEPVGTANEEYLYERYSRDKDGWKRRAYYAMKPFMPRALQLAVRRRYSHRQARQGFPSWPIEPVLVDAVAQYLRFVQHYFAFNSVYRMSPWPMEHRFCFVLTHDIEWDTGLKNALPLAELERDLGFVSSWNIVPERYPINWRTIKELRSQGFEIGIHGLRHDGKDFQSRRLFERRVERINDYARQWDASGFRSPSTMRNVEWMQQLDFEYDSSFPDTDPYEPQPGGCCSIWPFFIGNLVELPITMPQDHTLFEILGQQDIVVWKMKADWIEKCLGLVLVDVHPDYMLSAERLQLYEQFLQYMKNKPGMWHALPRDVARWWRERDASKLLTQGASFVVEGPASNRASILRTSFENGTIVDEMLDRDQVLSRAASAIQKEDLVSTIN